MIRQSVFGLGFTKRQDFVGGDPLNTTWAPYPKKQDNFFVPFVDGTPTVTADNFNNVTLASTAAWRALFNNFAADDFHAAAGSALATTTSASINPYDIDNKPRAATDIWRAHRLAA